MILAAIALALQIHATSADELCVIGRADGAEVFVTAEQRAPGDTVVRVAVCYVGSPTLPALGSFHGRLVFDSLHVSALSAEQLAGGVRAVNIARQGSVDFAGASASGFANGPLLAVLLRAPQGYRPTLRLEMIEANGVTKGTLLPQLRIVAVLPTIAADSTKETNLSGGSCPVQSSAAMPQRPTLTRLVPALVPLDSLVRGAVVTIEAEGCGFDRERNIVRLGRFVIAEVPSNTEGTRIRFAFPAQLPTGGEVAPLKPGAGSYAISVSTGALTSNSLTLEVR